jgi:glucose/mannose-6-phosphate isomerase
MNLDDLDYFQLIDPQNYIAHIDALPGQVAAAWTLAGTLALPEEFQARHSVVLIGRGDSAIAGDLARTVALPEARVPLVLHQGEGLPGFAGPGTLVIALSHSGGSAEVVAAAETALARGARVLAITTGGRLGTMPGLLAWTYPAGGDARTAFGYQTLLALGALSRLGLVTDPAASIAEAVEALEAQQLTLRTDSPVHRNPAKRMAGQLMQRYIVLPVVDELIPAGRRWQAQINQVAKAWAQCIPLAEADHAIAGMFFPEALVQKYLTLFLRGAHETAETARRAEAVRLAFMTNGFNTDAIAAAGRSRLAQLLTLSHYGDYVAYYLAMCYGIDPSPVPHAEL